MANNVMKSRFMQKCDTTANWQQAHDHGFVPFKGELIIYQDFAEDGSPLAPKFKSGDGKTKVGDLPFSNACAIENGEGENSLIQISSELNNAYSEGTVALGMGNIAGSKAYRIVAVSQEPTPELPTYTELPEGTYTLEEIDDNLQTGLSYTYRLEHSGYNIGTITHIDRDNKIVTVAPYIVEKMRSAGNYMSIVGHPEFGIIDVGYAAYAEGYQTMARESGSHSEGYATEALGRYSHVEGRDTKAWYGSHAEGSGSKAMGECAHAEGHFSNAKGFYSHSEGMADENQQDNYGAFGKGSHNEGRHTLAAADFSHAEGQLSTVAPQAKDGHAEGFSTTVNSEHGHAEGMLTISGGLAAHSEGRETEALGSYGHTEGYKSKVAVEAQDGHAEGYNTQALKAHTHAEGENVIASGQAAHAEGQNGEASGTAAHKEGQAKKASGTASHAEGIDTQATAGGAHAEGAWSQATAVYAHAEGKSTKATGKHAHSEGANTEARAENAHAEGQYTIAGSMNQHVQGKFNVVDTANEYAHIVGGGDETTRRNIHTLDWDGNGWFAGKIETNSEVLAHNVHYEKCENLSRITGSEIKLAYTDNAGVEDPNCYLSLTTNGLRHVYYGSDISIAPGGITCSHTITTDKLVANTIEGTVNQAADGNGNIIVDTYIPKPSAAGTLPVYIGNIVGNTPSFSLIEFDRGYNGAQKIVTTDEPNYGRIYGRDNWSTVNDLEDHELITAAMAADIVDFRLSDGFTEQITALSKIKIGDTELNEAQLKKILAFIDSIE